MLKTIKKFLEEKNPVEKDDYGCYISADYEDAFRDCKILLWETVGVWQGDYVVLVKGPDKRYGFTVIGYGSCSG